MTEQDLIASGDEVVESLSLGRMDVPAQGNVEGRNRGPTLEDMTDRKRKSKGPAIAREYEG